MSHKRKGQLTVSGEWARHLRPWHRREFWKAERQAQKRQALTEGAESTAERAQDTNVSILAVLTTVASREEARRIAATLVQRGLAACAQISEIESVYFWKGAVRQDPEFRLLLKTTVAQYPAVESAIRELHSYELPAIFAFAIEHAYGPYVDWVEEGASGGQSRGNA